jgi:hypothetical protein
MTRVVDVARVNDAAHIGGISREEATANARLISDGVVNEGCLLYLPPRGFYQATIREDIKYWNEYAKALIVQRRARNWQTAKVLRSAKAEGGSHG